MSTQGASKMTLVGVDGQTLKKGDVFTIANVFAVNPQTRESTGSLQQFVVTEDITAASSEYLNVKISPAGLRVEASKLSRCLGCVPYRPIPRRGDVVGVGSAGAV